MISSDIGQRKSSELRQSSAMPTPLHLVSDLRPGSPSTISKHISTVAKQTLQAAQKSHLSFLLAQILKPNFGIQELDLLLTPAPFPNLEELENPFQIPFARSNSISLSTKLNPCRLVYSLSFDESRSLAACQDALLVVDAA
ncbi:hypothetical protein ACFX13_030506 [Malus domestica]